MTKDRILNIINKNCPNFLEDWEVDYIINVCIDNNVQTVNGVLQEIDEYLTGIENSI